MLAWDSKNAATIKLEVPDGHGCISSVAVGSDTVVGVSAYGSVLVWKVVSCQNSFVNMKKKYFEQTH